MESPFSKHRLLGFDLAELPRDINGVLDGPHYQTFLTIEELRAYRSVVAELDGIWSGRTHTLAALGEEKVFVDLEANPYILSIREGYRFYSEQVLRDILNGRPVSRRRVMTVDFILTLPPKNYGGPLRYKGLYFKPKNVAQSDSGQRRKSKEQRTLEQIGWDWSPVNMPSDTRVDNLQRMRKWAKAWPIDDGARDAAELAALLYRTASTKDLDGLLRMLGKRLGISQADQYFVFAAAFYLGYVSVETEADLCEQAPLVLAQPARRPNGCLRHAQRR